MYDKKVFLYNYHWFIMCENIKGKIQKNIKKLLLQFFKFIY